MREEQEQYVNAISATESRILNALETRTPSLTSENYSSSEDSYTSLPSTPAVNVTVSDNMMLEVLKLLKELKDDRNQSDGTQKRNHDNNDSKKDNQNSSKRPYLTQEQRNKKKHESFLHYNMYCHSHGAGKHSSKKCKYPKPGHKREATFKNMMGGSTAYCQNCN